MPIVEGRGLVAPSPVAYRLTKADVAAIEAIAMEREGYRKYADRKDHWGRGIIRRAVFVGTCGEYAVCSMMGVPLDAGIKRYGDCGVDLEKRFSIQVKTRTSNSGTTLVKTTQASSTYLAACEWCAATLTVLALGYVSMQFVRTRNVAPGRGDWTNFVVRDEELLPFRRLVLLCR